MHDLSVLYTTDVFITLVLHEFCHILIAFCLFIAGAEKTKIWGGWISDRALRWFDQYRRVTHIWHILKAGLSNR